MILYDFYATWCNPCKALMKTLETIEFPQGYVLEKINIEENDDLVVKYNIRTVPTLVLVTNSGEEIERKIGNISKEQILNLCGINN
jgi:thioredoxin-like negative regulator of GroEL